MSENNRNECLASHHVPIAAHGSITLETRAHISRALKANHPTHDIMRRFGCDRDTVYEIARANKISLLNTIQVTELLNEITDGETSLHLASLMRVRHQILENAIAMPEDASFKWIRNILERIPA